MLLLAPLWRLSFQGTICAVMKSIAKHRHSFFCRRDSWEIGRWVIEDQRVIIMRGYKLYCWTLGWCLRSVEKFNELFVHDWGHSTIVPAQHRCTTQMMLFMLLYFFSLMKNFVAGHITYTHPLTLSSNPNNNILTGHPSPPVPWPLNLVLTFTRICPRTGLNSKTTSGSLMQVPTPFWSFFPSPAVCVDLTWPTVLFTTPMFALLLDVGNSWSVPGSKTTFFSLIVGVVGFVMMEWRNNSNEWHV